MSLKESKESILAVFEEGKGRAKCNYSCKKKKKRWVLPQDNHLRACLQEHRQVAIGIIELTVILMSQDESVRRNKKSKEGR